MKNTNIKNPVESVSTEVYKQLISYPTSFNQIIDCVLRAQNELNDAYNEERFSNAWTHPINDSTEWGCLYEREFRRRMNKIGNLEFVAGDHNTGEDLTCITDPKYSMEFKTAQGSQFWNTNSRSRKNKSTKYIDPNKKIFYVLVRHKIDEYGEFSAKTHVNKIYFGMMSKNDWKNPKGSGAAYLTSEKKENNFIEIWNDKIGNTIEAYQAKLDQEYSEYESGIEA